MFSPGYPGNRNGAFSGLNKKHIYMALVAQDAHTDHILAVKGAPHPVIGITGAVEDIFVIGTLPELFPALICTLLARGLGEHGPCKVESIHKLGGCQLANFFFHIYSSLEIISRAAS